MFATLVYHIINRAISDKNAISEEAFEAQLRYMHEEGYTTLSLPEAIDILDSKRQAPPRSILLTFDDGYVDNLYVAIPFLQRYGMSATLFVISAYVGQSNRWNPKACYDVNHLNWEELSRWLQEGCAIGGHTHTHHCMTRLTAQEVQDAVEVNKAMLEDNLSINIRAFAYPYGAYNALAQKVVSENYELAFAVDNGGIGVDADRYALHRLSISPKWSVRDFAKRVEHLVALHTSTGEQESRKV
jgi:peptidoglycan/xylan/chitin deacetylase (PgdA/CDA1 family)